jgi:hypothetical protein
LVSCGGPCGALELVHEMAGGRWLLTGGGYGEGLARSRFPAEETDREEERGQAPGGHDQDVGPAERGAEEPGLLASPDLKIDVPDRPHTGVRLPQAASLHREGSSRADLVVHAERPPAMAAHCHTQFRYGSFCSHVALPAEADARDITAAYQDGILEVSIGLAVRHEARKIEVATSREES